MPSDAGAGAIRRHRVPCLRGVDPEIRAKRLRAARNYQPHSIPRLAILLGHWDAGEIVISAGRPAKRKGRKRRGN